MTLSAHDGIHAGASSMPAPSHDAIEPPVEVEKPWGREVIWVHGPYTAKTLVISAGKRLSLQRHEEKTETVFVHRGRPVIRIGNASTVYEPGQTVHIPAGTVHRFEAPPEADVELFEVSTPEIGDVVRLDDDFGR
jgi:mannose-6-phosphate isomerase-like protein (cupin superfamily)